MTPRQVCAVLGALALQVVAGVVLAATWVAFVLAVTLALVAGAH